jgi:hypothetical protein
VVFLRKKILGKKGVEMTLNTVVVAILVLLVLVVIVGMFLGGTSQLKDFASRILRQNVAGTDIDLALGQCDQWCVQAKDRPSPELQASSPYCTKNFKLDTDGDGTAEYMAGSDDKEYQEFYCWDSPLNIICSGVSC